MFLFTFYINIKLKNNKIGHILTPPTNFKNYFTTGHAVPSVREQLTEQSIFKYGIKKSTATNHRTYEFVFLVV